MSLPISISEILSLLKSFLRKNFLFLALLLCLSAGAELLLANIRDFSIGSQPSYEVPLSSAAALDGVSVGENGELLVHSAGSSVEFTGLDVPSRTLTIYTSGNPGTVNIASCYLSDDASQYGYQDAGYLYFHPGGGHCYTRIRLRSNGDLHSLRLSFDRAKEDFAITRIVLNEKRGFHFDKLRFLLLAGIVFGIGLAVRFGWRNIRFQEGRPLHRLLFWGTALANLCVIFWIARALYSFGLGDSIPYPLEQPVSSYGAYVQQFDAFQKGQLALDLEPDARLAWMENVYDYTERTKDSSVADWDQPYWDRAYYDGQYYSYFGLGPLLTVYYPYYALTGSLPGDAFVSLVYSTAAVLLLFALVDELRRRFLPQVRLVPYLLGTTAAVFGSLLPLMLASSCFYYIAGNAAMAFLLLFLLLFFRAFRSPQGAGRRVLAAGAGISLLLLVLSRPNVSVAAVFAAAPCAVLYLLEKDTPLRFKLKDMACFLLPLAAGGAALCAYNYARFGSPLEFGTSYQLTVSDITYNAVSFGPEYLLGYVYYYILQPLATELVFPFIRLDTGSIFVTGNYMYHAASMGLLAIPIHLFLGFYPHRYIHKDDRCKRFTYLAAIAGCLAVSYLDYCIGGVFVRYLCDISMVTALFALLIILEYEARIRDGCFAGRVILAVFAVTIFLGAMLVFSNENCLLLNDAPEYYLRIMDIFRLG